MKSIITHTLGTKNGASRDCATKLSPLALALHLTLAAGLALGPLQAAQAQTTAMVRADVPAGPLADALNRFALQAGVVIVMDANKIKGLRSPGLKGGFGVEEGFNLLLRGSGYAIDKVAAGYTLRAAPAATQPAPARPAADASVGTDVEMAVMPVVEVHASLRGDPLEERMSLSAAKIIIGREEIEAFGDASMGEVIRRMPSISFGGPPGENNDARIRGLNKEYTQLLIDGQPVPGRDFAIDQIPAHLVERLEIIRTTTANIDNQGIAGTVNIILKKPPKERVAKWTAGVGAMPDAPGDGKSMNLGMTYGNAVEGFRYQFDATAQNRFGVRTKDRQDFNNGLDVLTNREKDFEVREHREAAISGRLTWQLNALDEFRLDPRYTYSSENKERDRLKKATLSDAERMDQIKTRQYAGLNGQWQRAIGNDQRYVLGFNLQHTRTDVDKEERKGAAGLPFTSLPTFVSGNDDRITEDGIALRASMQKRLARTHALDMGVDLSRVDWDMTKVAWKKEDRSDAKRNQFTVFERKFAAYAQDEILLGERHVLTPGLRLEYVETRSRVNQAAARESDHLQPSPSLHWLTNLTEATNWRASVTRSIRRPKFDDLASLTETKSGTVADPDKVGNPELKPETAWAVETSIERYFHDRAGVASVNLFHRSLDDLIEKSIRLNADNGRFEQIPINVETARTWGVELDGSYRVALAPAHSVVLRGNYSWLDSSVTDAYTGKKRTINDQPEHILNAGIDYEYKPWKLKAGVNFNQVGKLQKADVVGANYRVQRQEPSRYLDAFLTFPVAKNLNLRISGINLLEAEKNRPRVTTKPDGSVALREQEDEASARAFFVKLEGRF